MSYFSGASLSSPSTARMPAMPLPMTTSFSFIAFLRAGPSRSGVIAFGQESQQLFAQRVVVRVFEQHLARARARQIDFQDFTDPGVRAVGHHPPAVAEQDRLVHVVSDEHGRDLGALPYFHQHFLQVPAGK